MDASRVRRWKMELSTRVDEELGDDRKKNVFWLIEHLAEYIQRWVGFSRMEEIGVTGTLNTDTFCILLGASQVVNEQLEKQENEWFPAKEWGEFENALDYIHEYPSVDNLGFVTESFSRLWEALPKE